MCNFEEIDYFKKNKEMVNIHANIVKVTHIICYNFKYMFIFMQNDRFDVKKKYIFALYFSYMLTQISNKILKQDSTYIPKFKHDYIVTIDKFL